MFFGPILVPIRQICHGRFGNIIQINYLYLYEKQKRIQESYENELHFSSIIIEELHIQPSVTTEYRNEGKHEQNLLVLSDRVCEDYSTSTPSGLSTVPRYQKDPKARKIKQMLCNIPLLRSLKANAT